MDAKTINTLSNIQFTESDKISYRFKQRISLFILDDPKLGKIRLDLTIVKSSNLPDKLSDATKEFEVELEYTVGSNTPPISLLGDINKEVINIKQVLDTSIELISKEEIDNVLLSYKKLVYNIESDTQFNLYTMQPISTEVQHIVDKIPNKYCVSDKLDGDKFQSLTGVKKETFDKITSILREAEIKKKAKGSRNSKLSI
jgi:hypothetical protein